MKYFYVTPKSLTRGMGKNNKNNFCLDEVIS
jgi:hypothetical protein